ncbi:MAG: sigma factor-like helix-turn-helix DNA-binding protein [Chloroherpetonaceae bacterium]|nr:hypothetical protein [Chthonomonadaceae bacterium]MDW8208658.1 sigma factor-like helix-turn-helix DNA-binding protein [Chloroherpetonaceae bacterium]
MESAPQRESGAALGTGGLRAHHSGNADDPAEETLRHAVEVQIAEALQALTPGQRVALVQRYFYNRTFVEIARDTGRTPDAVRIAPARNLWKSRASRRPMPTIIWRSWPLSLPRMSRKSYQ